MALRLILEWRYLYTYLFQIVLDPVELLLGMRSRRAVLVQVLFEIRGPLSELLEFHPELVLLLDEGAVPLTQIVGKLANVAREPV